MRWRVDTRFGYISFDESEEGKAREHFEREGVALRRCDDIHDEGEIVEGWLPAGEWAAA